MDAQVANAITAIALGNSNAMLHLLLALARRGLVSSEDIDAIAHGFTNPLDELAGEPVADELRAILDSKLSPLLARIYEVARQAESR